MPGEPGATQRPIVFYDGDCGLCHGFVQFIIARDRRGIYQFAPLQGSTAARLIPSLAVTPSTVVLKDGRGLHLRSEASLRVLAGLGGPWTIVGGLRLLPRRLRDAVYDVIATRRLGWFGAADRCVLPVPHERTRFLP